MLVRNMSAYFREMVDKISPKNTEQYHCKICDFKGSRYSEYKRHIATAKHIKLTNADKNITTNVPQHICVCVCVCVGNNYIVTNRIVVDYRPI